MRPLYIFDLDGTIALIDHRRPILESGTSDRWDRFYAACVDDDPNWPVIRTMTLLRKTGDVHVWSGRSQAVEDSTIDWFNGHVGFCPLVLQMRPVGDYTPDQELKGRWYESMPQEDKDRLVAVFDDRQKVVDMWRSKGVACFQVAPGDF